MEKKAKKIFGFGIVLGGAILLSSCNSFCTTTDISNYLYSSDPINTTFFDSVEHGEDYIESTFGKIESFDKEARFVVKDQVKIQQVSEDGKKITTVVYDPELVFEKINDNLYKIKPVDLIAEKSSKPDQNNNRSDISYTFGLNDFTRQLITACKQQNVFIPSYDYFDALDDKYLDEMFKKADEYTWLSGLTKENITYNQIYGYSYNDLIEFRKDETNKALLNEMINGDKQEDGKTPSKTNPGRNYSFLTTLGHIKFEVSEENTNYYQNIEKWTNELVAQNVITGSDIPSVTFNNAYQQSLNNKAAGFRTCITVNDGFYGHISNDPLNDTILIEGKGQDFYEGWGKAFSEHGFLEGLLVYPIGTMVENLSHAFGMNGYGQIGAVLITTIIIRLLFMLITLPSTLSQQKMQFLQPEIAKLQQKYPNSDTNQYEKQKFAMAQMALYKKYKIHPFRQFLVIFIQFPLFICVWNAFAGSASLSSDAVLGLRLSDTVWSALTNVNGWPGQPGWWTALVLIILMSAIQILAMFVPNWLNKSRNKKIAKTGRNQALDTQNKTMKITQWVMTIVVIIMGFNVPAALGVYWFAGALFQILQSVALHFVFLHKQKKGRI